MDPGLFNPGGYHPDTWSIHYERRLCSSWLSKITYTTTPGLPLQAFGHLFFLLLHKANVNKMVTWNRSEGASSTSLLNYLCGRKCCKTVLSILPTNTISWGLCMVIEYAPIADHWLYYLSFLIVHLCFTRSLTINLRVNGYKFYMWSFTIYSYMRNDHFKP